jgi:hypothetical protein
MNVKNKLGRATGIAAAAAAIGALGLTGVASASTAQPAAVTSMSYHAKLAAAAVVPEQNGCYATGIPGSLLLGYGSDFHNALGPLFTSGVCLDININLTSAPKPTYARACLIPSGGGGLQCPDWPKAPLHSGWQILRLSVLGGTQWQLQMKSPTGLEQAVFSYTA